MSLKSLCECGHHQIHVSGETNLTLRIR
uniref:Uncharacterized protein n=1 Tax=Arundo donax TaxID=35708 RepID=A0A0A8ZUQ6_ARUDO